MAKVEPRPSRGQQMIQASFTNKNGTMPVKGMFVLSMGTGVSCSEGPDRILFSDGVPVAIVTGGFMYVQDTYRTRQVMAHVNRFEEETESDTVVRTGPDNFDFILGSLLTKAGLPLTKRRKDGEG